VLLVHFVRHWSLRCNPGRPAGQGKSAQSRLRCHGVRGGQWRSLGYRSLQIQQVHRRNRPRECLSRNQATTSVVTLTRSPGAVSARRGRRDLTMNAGPPSYPGPGCCCCNEESLLRQRTPGLCGGRLDVLARITLSGLPREGGGGYPLGALKQTAMAGASRQLNSGADMISLLDPHLIGRHTVVGVAGELDVASAPALRDTLLGLLNRGATSLVVDLRGVSFMDSTGVGSLLRIHHRQSLLGGSVHFIADQPSVLRVLDLMQLRRRLHVTATVAAVETCCPTPPMVLDDRPTVATH